MARESWHIDVEHEGLHKYRRITGSDKWVVEQKAAALQLQWSEQWLRQLEREEKKLAREELALEREEKGELAAERSEEATALLDLLDSLLEFTLDIDDTVEWEKLKDTEPFSAPYPEKPGLQAMPPEPKFESVKPWDFPFKPEATPPDLQTEPREPSPQDSVYSFKYGCFTLAHVLPRFRERKERELRQKFEFDHQQWELAKQRAESAKRKHEESCQRALADWELAVQQAKLANAKLEEDYQQETTDWERLKREHQSRRQQVNENIDAKKADYLAGEPGAVLDYCDMVLENSVYPEFFPKSWEIDYIGTSGMVVVDYTLPSPDDMPTLREVKYVQSRDEFDEKHLTAAQQNKLYDSVLYQVALRTIHELIEADTADAIKAATFNGWVTAIDKATGKAVTGCLLTVQASKEEFEEINLRHVEPKACFKKLKGIGSSKLHGLAPVAPIMRIEREDARFIESSEVASNVDRSTNIAAMDWQEFEHLVRELFEKEFAVAGGEVRVTRASRDAGVDAVIFDPDPIRGGKIVVQAKRYTNTVGVDAVRDLYGTTINEGATKGILITTSDYGPDAYAFAKDKPMVLLSGNNLLHLLAKHGHTARIDLKEAKKLLADEKQDGIEASEP